MTTTLLLVRHGETDWNRDGRWQGGSDTSLNDLGREQARALAELLAEGLVALDLRPVNPLDFTLDASAEMATHRRTLYIPIPGLASQGAEVQGTRYTEFGMLPADWRVLGEVRAFF